MTSRHTTGRRRAFLPMQELIGTSVSDKADNRLGCVTEFLVDRIDGRIAYVRIRLEDDSRRRSCEVTVPWSSLRTSGPSRSTWQLRAGRATLGKLRGPGGNRQDP